MKKIMWAVLIVGLLVVTSLSFLIYHNSTIAGDDNIIDLGHCVVDADCIPLPSECHPTECINKNHEFMFEKPEMCTEIFMLLAAYNLEDCICVNNNCTNKNLEKQNDISNSETCIDLDGGKDYYVSSGFRNPCSTNTSCGIFGEYCDEDRLHEEWCEEGELKEEYHICPNGCSNGACNP